MTKTETGEYSSSEAPEIRKHAEEREGNYSDWRLVPGGVHGLSLPQGIEALYRETVPGEATEPVQTRYPDAPKTPDRERRIPHP